LYLLILWSERLNVLAWYEERLSLQGLACLSTEMSCSNGTTTMLCSCLLRGNQQSLCGHLNVANGKISSPEVISNLFNAAQSTVT